ncbi:hypothetical protein ILUMI_17307, partial [Ignelater luminosus]
MSSDDNVPVQNLINTSKKKKIRGRVLEASKHLRNHTRRPRKDEGSARLRDKSYTYKVRIQHAEGPFEEISVCQAAFISFHEITNRSLCTIKWYMKTKGRELHKAETENKPHKSKAEAFYKAKRSAKKKSRKQDDWEAITMDYAKNLP